jgi:hypothetical protein
MLFKEIIAVYNENYTEPLNTNYRVNIVMIEGTYIYH